MPDLQRFLMQLKVLLVRARRILITPALILQPCAEVTYVTPAGLAQNHRALRKSINFQNTSKSESLRKTGLMEYENKKAIKLGFCL